MLSNDFHLRLPQIRPYRNDDRDRSKHGRCLVDKSRILIVSLSASGPA